jgi:AcrR family transcriptional regulator
MKRAIKQRARNDEQKEGRRSAILNAAWGMFCDTAYPTVTMLGVAKRVGLAKGTLYLYFKTKEELFLALQIEQLASWFYAVDQRLATLPTPSATEAVAEVIIHSLKPRTHLTRLLAILSTVLEQNIDEALALDFKRFLRGRLTTTGALLEARLPQLGVGGGLQFLLRLQAIIVGLRHLADPSPVIQTTLTRPEMQIFVVDFETELAATVHAVLRGWSAATTP